MDSVNHSSLYTPRKTKLAQTFAKALLKRLRSTKSLENTNKKDRKNTKNVVSSSLTDQNIDQAFLAKLFANISTIKAAYALMQHAQCPYDADEIQSSDQVIVSELTKLSELKHRYINKTLNEIISPESTLLSSEIQEQNSLLTTYSVTCKKLDSQIKLKDSEIIFLKEKLAEANSEKDLLELRLKSNGEMVAVPENIELSGLRTDHFITYRRLVIKSTRSFARLLMSEMEFSGWDLELAARSIQPGVYFRNLNHICYVFESFVCREMFDGFDHPYFSVTQTERKEHRRVFFDRFLELKSVMLADYLAWKPKSKFAIFCQDKYLRLVRSKIEASIFGNLDQRDSVSSGEFPETPFFSAFCEMAKHVWLLHCLASSFDPEVSIFQVSKKSRFSEVYMESLNDEAFASCGPMARVAFTVVPGFMIGKSVVQCQVYLR